MNEIPFINMIGGKKNNILNKGINTIKNNAKHLHNTANTIKNNAEHLHKAANHAHETLNNLNAHMNTTLNLSNHTEQVLNQTNFGFFSKIYNSIVEIGDEFWKSIIAGLVITAVKIILYDNYNKDVDISNVSNVVEANNTYDTDIRKQRKLLYYIKNKFKWAEFTSSTANTLFTVMLNSWLIHKLATYGLNFDYILILIAFAVGWYSGFLDLIISFIENWIKDDNSKKE